MFQEYLHRHWVRVLLSLAILCFFLVHALKWYEWELINRFENIAYDLRLLVTMPDTLDDRVQTHTGLPSQHQQNDQRKQRRHHQAFAAYDSS